MTLSNLTMHGVAYGLRVYGGSDSLNASYITAFDNTDTGIDIETNSPFGDFSHLTAYDNSYYGIRISGAIRSLTDSTAFDNDGTGIDVQSDLQVLSAV